MKLMFSVWLETSALMKMSLCAYWNKVYVRKADYFILILFFLRVNAVLVVFFRYEMIFIEISSEIVFVQRENSVKKFVKWISYYEFT